MKSRDYPVVVDQAEQVRALSPDIAALAKLDIVNGGTIVTAAGEGDVDYVCRLFSPSEGIDEDPATARYTAHWLHIGRGGWVRTCCVRNNSVPAVDTCSAQSVAIA
jgi:predicted PhzF superfamily epimerase YddE/YHI9